MSSPTPTQYTERIYATKHGVPLPLRVWRCTTSPTPEDSNYADPMDSAFSIGGTHGDSPAPRRKPWLFWSHGGGFMGGSLVPAPWVLPAFQGWCHVVSYGYRLAPQAGVDDMVEDGADAFAWCRKNLPDILDDVDMDAYAVGGLSSGGTLALLNARQLTPRPRAVLDAYGITDFGDAYFDPKFTGPGYDPGTVSGRYSEGELERAIADRNPAHALTSLAGDTDPDAESAAQALYARVLELFGGARDRRALQQDIRVHVAATSRIMRVLTRREKFKDNDAWRVAATAQSPIALVDASFPPTVVLHGTIDKVVPVDQSVRLAKKLKFLGVDVKEVYAGGSQHCFDFELIEPSFEAWKTYIDPVVDFVRARIEPLPAAGAPEPADAANPSAPATDIKSGIAAVNKVAASVAQIAVSDAPAPAPVAEGKNGEAAAEANA